MALQNQFCVPGSLKHSSVVTACDVFLCLPLGCFGGVGVVFWVCLLSFWIDITHKATMLLSSI